MHDNDARFVSRGAARLGADDELALQVWDGELRDQSPERMGGAASDTVLLGSTSGIGSAADEARAMIRLLVEKGEIPAAFDMPRTNLVARLEAQMAAVLQMALTVSGQADGDSYWCRRAPIDTLLAIRLGRAGTPAHLDCVLPPRRPECRWRWSHGSLRPPRLSRQPC